MKRASAFVVLAFTAACAFAAEYPTKPVRIISPFPPGGSVDLVARLVGAELSKLLGQQIVIDNRSGASGMIGTELAKNAAPDGYTLPGYEFTTWQILAAPKATPGTIIATLNEKVRAMMKTPDSLKRWQDRGLDVIASTPEEMAAHLTREIKKWGAVFKEQGIKSE